ncbi:hypothetical protein ACSI5N_25555 (plasmid) [Raoultella ornithinolytica]|uniref:hypothetical protein n=1 Tax=Raoultella ornithinolytica TaxID=54291 RepID=UPI00292AF864|nr:hypothetical protein [Raoultella ornithinolytica]MDV1094993.1 hypothetical protein [Raoultella ornithinolytica]MDV1122663.1 hypothetical protein [Raoultella ornithinolytica]MDV1893178.1 hypothetical protein [Raoultella ornithinolytica]
MNLVNARKILKQHSHTIRRVINVLDNAPTSAEFVHRTLRKQGGKDTQSVITQYIQALVVAGKAVTTSEGLFTTDLSLKCSQEVAGHATTKMRDVWPEPASAPNQVSNDNPVTPHAEPTQEPPAVMDINLLSPEQLTLMAAQMQKLAEQKSRELNPELLRQLLEGIEGVVSASDLLAESIEKLRSVANLVRQDRGLPVAKG